MSSHIETRLHLAEPSYFMPNAEAWPCNMTVHRYVECRDYDSPEAALAAVTSPGFFNPCQRGGIKQNDRIAVQIGERTAEALFLTLAVDEVPQMRADPIIVRQIGPVVKAGE